MATARNGAATPDEYIASLPEDRRIAVTALREVINNNLPDGFEECISYGMIGWVVPHSLYPAGYHCDPKLPLGFMALGSQKNYISLHAMCLYGSNKHLEWFQSAWPNYSDKKLNMGKGCIRFGKLADIPLELIGKLVGRVTPQQWVEIYEDSFRSRKRER